jgi:hypothetical protein
VRKNKMGLFGKNNKKEVESKTTDEEFKCDECGQIHRSEEDMNNCCLEDDEEATSENDDEDSEEDVYVCNDCEAEYDTQEEADECCAEEKEFMCTECEKTYDTDKEAVFCCNEDKVYSITCHCTNCDAEEIELEIKFGESSKITIGNKYCESCGCKGFLEKSE